jgi:hypothetical protein
LRHAQLTRAGDLGVQAEKASRGAAFQQAAAGAVTPFRVAGLPGWIPAPDRPTVEIAMGTVSLRIGLVMAIPAAVSTWASADDPAPRGPQGQQTDCDQIA